MYGKIQFCVKIIKGKSYQCSNEFHTANNNRLLMLNCRGDVVWALSLVCPTTGKFLKNALLLRTNSAKRLSDKRENWVKNE